MNVDFDYIGYVVKYDCKYNSGNTFAKGCFKFDPEQIVPIVWYNSDVLQMFDRCFGGAKLEDCDDGIAAKCVFNKDDLDCLVLDLLNSGDLELSFYACPFERNDGIVTFADIKAVMVLPKSDKPRIVEE